MRFILILLSLLLLFKTVFPENPVIQNLFSADPAPYEEGPWFYKKNNTYYMVFAGGQLPEHIAYSTSNSPTSPWTYKGIIMPNQSGLAFTNHAGVCDFKNNPYLFYHNQELSGGEGYRLKPSVRERVLKQINVVKVECV